MAVPVKLRATLLRGTAAEHHHRRPRL